MSNSQLDLSNIFNYLFRIIQGIILLMEKDMKKLFST